MVRNPPNISSPLLRDYELDSVPLGPATRVLTIETDPTGGVFYQFSKREPRSLQLPDDMGLKRLTLIERVQSTALIDPRTLNLVAFAAYLGVGTRIVALGKHWGEWIDEHGIIKAEDSIVERCRQWNVPLAFNAGRRQLSFEFIVNQHNPRAFVKPVAELFRPSAGRHVLKLVYSYPAGAYQGAQLIVHRRDSEAVLQLFGIEEFPIVMPEITEGGYEPEIAPPPPSATQFSQYGGAAPETSAPNAARKAEPSPRKNGGAATSRVVDDPGLHDSFTHRPAAQRAPEPKNATRDESPTPPPPNPERVLRTEFLGVLEVVRVLKNEPDADRRWAIIEDNLRLGRPERTYPLLVNYSEAISGRVQYWAPARLKAAFGAQPAAVLIPLMENWRVNQVLHVAEEHAEKSAILDWLRDHEIERLLKLDTASQIITLQQAREAMGIDANVEEARIKKIWRMQLGFLNADKGRSAEHAIHRKKDDIAKYLQDARNKLIGGK